MSLGKPPREIPRQSSLALCAPLFTAAVDEVMQKMNADGFPSVVIETLRTTERQEFLYGFSRLYDDGRGEVTKSRTALHSWHGYGLAADIVHASRYWSATEEYWKHLEETANAFGLKTGRKWKKPDRPHVFWGKCRKTPSPRARQLLASGGMVAVWQEVGAI